MAGPIPIARPLPHIANHVIEPIAVRLEASDGGGAGVSVLLSVDYGEDPLPGVGDRFAVGVEGAAPVVLAIATATRGIFPLCLGGETAPQPAGVCQRVLVGNMRHRMVFAALDRAVGPLGMSPVGTGNVVKPLRHPATALGIRRHDEGDRAWC